MPTSGDEIVQLPAAMLEKMQATIAALSEKVGLQEDEILDPLWPKTVYRQDPNSEAEEHDHLAWKASFESKRMADQAMMDAYLADGWSTDPPKAWNASYVTPRPPKAKREK